MSRNCLFCAIAPKRLKLNKVLRHTDIIMNKTLTYLITAATLSSPTLFGAITQNSYILQNGVNGYNGSTGLEIRVNGSKRSSEETESFFLDGLPGDDGLTGDTDNRRDGLFSFQDALAQLPTGATIIKAALVFTTESTPDAQSTNAFNVYRLLTSFDTNSTTYENYSSSGGVAFGESADLLSGSFRDKTNSPNTVVRADVTRIVQSWKNGATNYGFGVKSDFNGNGWAIHSSGSSTIAARPQLEISYTTDAVQIYEYQQLNNGYTGGINVVTTSALTDTVVSTTPTDYLDGNNGVDSFDEPYYLRFDNIENDIAGKTIEMAELKIVTAFDSSNAGTNGEFTLHKLLKPFSGATVYDDFAGDLQAMLEAGEISEAIHTFGGIQDNEVVTADVTATLQAWADGEENYGFYMAAAGTADGWKIFTNEAEDPSFAPYLRVITSEAVPEPTTAVLALLGLAAISRRRRC